ncbi:hypothetical protein GALMADRAFT_254076 [Galerina marginata CBS 339.88]|uniref:Uncharacterized protein n=1 Tax=Galerina marginata (strain CBS 339.88) TaxID=685588 RepID=A0A067SK31_GALM3|nr:hypothetical protein GALMADRAFT_254076 [Galerina marginata CBS 339.88]
MPPTALTPAELGTIAGPLFLGYLLNWGLFGVLSMQVYLYYLAFPNDRAGFKTVVYVAYLLETTQTILFTTSSFRTFATGFGNPGILDEIDIVWFSAPIMSGLVAFVAHSFYAYRITFFSKRKYLPGCVILLACLCFSASIAVGVEMKGAGFFSHFLKKNSLVTVGIWQAGSAACDLLIAASMTYYVC